MSIKDDSFGIADLQEKLLELLKYFISLCEENNLTYWLAGGTVLGALRHEGFIPWDDDLDVCMPRDDYEKLWTIYKKECPNKKYKLCRTTLHKNYHHRVLQLVDLETTFINKRSVNENIEHGIYIDIIPLDAKAPNKISWMFQFINVTLFSIFNIQNEAEFNGGRMTFIINSVTNLLLRIIKNPKTRYRIWKKAEKRMLKYEINEDSDLIILTSQFRELFKPYPYEWWFGNRTAQFEDIQVSIPANAEGYCSAMYGDYMKLPPKEDQKVKHNTVFIDANNPYTNYYGIYYCKKN